jgi:hypothetical protein
VVSATDPHGRILGFLDPEPLLFLPSSSSIMLMRLSGPRSRPTTSQKIYATVTGLLIICFVIFVIVVVFSRRIRSPSCLGVCVSPVVAAKQRSLLFDERRVRPVSVGA